MKHLALFLCLLWLVPVCGLCETILWEDEAGQVILGDDGNVQFISPDGEAADENFFVPTAVPSAERHRMGCFTKAPDRGPYDDVLGCLRDQPVQESRCVGADNCPGPNREQPRPC